MYSTPYILKLYILINLLFLILLVANDLNVYTQTIGKVTSENKLIINDLVDIDRDLLHKAYYNSIKDIME